jgi:hypothetical protein
LNEFGSPDFFSQKCFELFITVYDCLSHFALNFMAAKKAIFPLSGKKKMQTVQN